MHGSFHRYRQALRFPALAMLMLAVLVNPTFATLADLHESNHTQSGHLHEGDEHGVDAHEVNVHVVDTHDTDPHEIDPHDAGIAMQDHDGDSDLLHALMHASHCCGHLTAILVGMQWLSVPLSPVAAPLHAANSPHSQLFGNHFRPPITV